MAAMEAANRKDERIIASPLARRLAQQAGLELSRLAGSGPHGRIIKRDIEAAMAGVGSAAAPSAGRQEIATMARAARSEAPSLPDAKILALYDKGTYEVVPHDKMRRVIAERLTQA